MYRTFWAVVAACAPDTALRPGGPAPGAAPDPTVPPDPTDPPVVTSPTPSTPTPGTTPGEPGTLTAADCFAALWGADPPVDYDQFAPVMGSHCLGTDHQEIEGIERVVYVGDSIAVGTPPTPTASWWRNQTADAIAARFGLEPPGALWRNVNLVDGVVYETFSGDFAACAKWGARTDDLLQSGHEQLVACLPEEDRDLRTLVIMVVGGNDIFSLLEDVRAGVDEATLRATYDEAIALLREGVDWLLEPGRFPNGVYVVFANTYDFTDPDGAEEMASCDGARLIGLDEPLRDPVFQSIMADAQEAYVELATETGTDLVFLGEGFCGHGFARDDPASRCYRGPGAELYYDLTCEHPNEAGHDAITEMVLRTIDE